jgi:aldose sugar dehydrogenase
MRTMTTSGSRSARHNLATHRRRIGAMVLPAVMAAAMYAVSSPTVHAVQYQIVYVPVTVQINGKPVVIRRPVVRPVAVVAIAPSITTEPADVTAIAGQPAVFTVTAAGTAPLSYQWRRNGQPITGANEASYTLAKTELTDTASTFSVVVTNAKGDVTSREALLKVNIDTVAPKLTTEPVISGLSGPWDLAFLPDGAMLFTEKCSGLSVRRNGQVTRLFGTSGSSLVASDFFCEGQTGMHGVAVDPAFGTSNRYIYVYMSSNLSNNPRTNRVVRLVLDAAGTSVSGRTDIITDIAFKNVGNNWGGSGSHSGGRLRFGPDGYLYVTTGDNHNGTLPQDPNRLGGKVLRVDRDGKGAPGNKSPGDARIFTYGHRNVQGISFRPGTGQPFSSEHGPGHSDEVTPLVAGGNGGWDPKPDAGVSCADDYCGYISNNLAGTPTSMTDLAKFPSAMRPAWNNRGLSQGTGPNTFLVGSQWRSWNGRLAVGVMGGQRLDILTLDAAGIATAGITAPGLPVTRYRSLVPGPDGKLYVATDSGEIFRIVAQ